MKRLVSISILSVCLLVLMTSKIWATGSIEVLWLGHSTTLIKSINGKVILVDPFLTKNPKTPAKYRDLKTLGKIDLILVTHGHPDHAMDVQALADLNDAIVVSNWDYTNNLVSMGILEGDKIIAMNKGGTVEPIGGGIKIHMVPAEHSSSIDLVVLGHQKLDKKEPRYIFGGPAVGFIVELENGFKIYHTGDTWLFGDMAFIGELYKPDLALVCIGGYFTMGPDHAAYAVRNLVKPKQVLPIHYGTIPAINRTPGEFKKALGNTQVKILDAKPGDTLFF